MELFLLLGAYFVTTFGGVFCNKKNSNVLRGGTTDHPVYIIMTATVACLFFAVMNGFHIRINAITWGYAAVFALIVLASLLLSLLVYRFAKIPTVSVVNSTLSLIATSVLGTFLFSETPAPATGIRIGLLVLASVLLYVSSFFNERNSGEPRADGGKSKRGIRNGICFAVTVTLMIADSCAVTFLTKSYAIREDVSDANSYYFATNVILFAVGAVWLAAAGKGKFRRIASGLRTLRPVDYLFIFLSTVSSNVNSLVTMFLVGMLEVASYSAYTSAIGIVAAAAASLCFREKQNVFSVSAIAIAAVSFLIGLL